MKNIIIIITFTLISSMSFAQEQPTKVVKYVTTFPNGEEAITIIESSNSNILKLTSADNFYKYEILELANHELVHKATNKGKRCDIDKSELEEGNYTLKYRGGCVRYDGEASWTVNSVDPDSPLSTAGFLRRSRRSERPAVAL